MSMYHKIKRYFNYQKKKSEEKKEIIEMIVPEIKFQTQHNEESEYQKIIGKIEYEWFTISQQKIIRNKRAQTSLQPSFNPSLYQDQIQKKLRQIDDLISTIQSKINKKVFCSNSWQIRLDIDPQNKPLLAYRNIFKNQEDSAVESLQQIVCFMSESRARNLILHSDRKELLLMFSHITFRNLKVLTLKERLSSLEPLEWMDCPNLTSLTIVQCTISSLKPLAKLSASVKLNSMTIENLQNPSFQHISRIKKKNDSTLRITPYYIKHKLLHYQIFLQDFCQLSKAENGWGLIHSQGIRYFKDVGQINAVNSKTNRWKSGLILVAKEDNNNQMNNNQSKDVQITMKMKILLVEKMHI